MPATTDAVIAIKKFHWNRSRVSKRERPCPIANTARGNHESRKKLKATPTLTIASITTTISSCPIANTLVLDPSDAFFVALTIRLRAAAISTDNQRRANAASPIKIKSTFRTIPYHGREPSIISKVPALSPDTASSPARKSRVMLRHFELDKSIVAFFNKSPERATR